MITRRRLLRDAGLLAAGATLLNPSAATAADVTTATDGLGFQYGDPLRPFNKSWMCQPVPTNVYLDPADNGAVGAEIASQVAAYGTYINIDARYSAEPYNVPASAPLIPVTVTKGGYHIQACGRLGVPAPPAGVTPATSGEPTLCLYQPERAGKYNRPGYLFELYKWAITATDTSGNPTALSAEDLARFTGVNTDTKAHSYTWTGGPGASAYATDVDSTYTDSGYSYVTGSGTPYAASVVTLADARRNLIDHIVGLELVRSIGHVWPAQRSDGTSTGNIMHEGDRVILLPEDVNPNVHPLCLLAQWGAVHYGQVVNDMSGSVAIRFAPSIAAAGYVGATPLYRVLDGFPWSKLKRISPTWPDGTPVGDTNQMPTT